MDYSSQTALGCTIERGYLKIVRLLLNNEAGSRAKRVAEAWIPFHMVVNSGQDVIVERIVEAPRVKETIRTMTTLPCEVAGVDAQLDHKTKRSIK